MINQHSPWKQNKPVKKYESEQKLLEDIPDAYVDSMYDSRNTNLFAFLDQKNPWIVGCHVSPLKTFDDASSHQVFRLLAISKEGSNKTIGQRACLLENNTSKIQGAGRGVFAAKSFDKDEIISVYTKKKNRTHYPLLFGNKQNINFT